MTRRRRSGPYTRHARTVRLAFEQLWREADERARRFIVVTIFLILSSAAVAGLAPLILKCIIDVLQPFQSHVVFPALALLAIVYAFAHWLSKALREIGGWTYGCAEQRIQRRLSATIFRHLLALPLRFHLGRRTGALGQTLTNGLSGYRVVLSHVALTLLPVAVEAGTACAVLTLFDHAVFLWILGTSALFYVLAFLSGVATIVGPAETVSRVYIDAHATLTDSILNYETVKFFTAEARIEDRFASALAMTEESWIELLGRKAKNGIVIATIFAVSLCATMFISIQNVRQGTMTFGDFVLVNTYVLQVTRPLESIGIAFRGIAEGMGFIASLLALLDQDDEEDTTGNRTVSVAAPDIIFDRVSCCYRPNRYVLKNVGFTVRCGETVAIVGGSGSGKSSLVRLLVRLLEPAEGTIRLGGVPLDALPLGVLRNSIAVVPQDIALFNASIAFNIGLGNPEHSGADIIRAARIAHLHDRIVRLRDGYQTKVGERGIRLSGGEKQRLAIARAVIRRPQIFVFDEATSSLDTRMERAILNDLGKITKQATTLVIAHRLSTVVKADEIVVLERGMVVECGDHDGLLRQGGVYAAMWHAQHGPGNELPDNASVA